MLMGPIDQLPSDCGKLGYHAPSSSAGRASGTSGLRLGRMFKLQEIAQKSRLRDSWSRSLRPGYNVRSFSRTEILHVYVFDSVGTSNVKG